MSEKKPESKDRSAVTTALIGAGAVIVTAVISSIVAPIVLRGFESSPTPIVITVTPPTTAVSQATSIPPTATREPTATIVQPTLEISPTIALRVASTTPRPPSPTPNNIVTLVLVNNLPNAMEFFVDGVSVTSIDSGAYQVVPIARGTRELKQCLFGSDTNNPNNCLATSAVFNNAVDYWEMFETNSSIPPQSRLKLLVLNQSSTSQEIFMDGIFAKTVDARSFIELNGPGGLHTIQPCAMGETPASGNCGERQALQLSKRIEIYKILGNVP